jgi:activator of HSP90 ATPase
MILPTKDSAADLAKLDLENSKKAPDAVNAKSVLTAPVASKAVQQQRLGVKIQCRNLSTTEEFKCSVDELYRALTDKEMVRAFTQNMAQLDAEKGGRFVMFNGNVSGEFTELVLNKKIEMRWRFKTWPDEHYSNVTIDLTQKDDGTELRLTQTGVPTSEYDRTKEGWQNYYWKSIKQTFGYGAFIY